MFPVKTPPKENWASSWARYGPAVILIRLPLAECTERNASLCTPRHKALGDEFLAIVQPNRLVARAGSRLAQDAGSRVRLAHGNLLAR